MATIHGKLPFYDQIKAQLDTGVEVACVDLRPANQIQNIPRILTLQQAQNVFKLDIDRGQGWNAISVGQGCWRLIALYFRTGTAQSISKVVDQSGNVIEGVLGLSSWPDGGPPHHRSEPDKAIHPDYSYDGYFDAGFTNASGDFAVTMGPEGHISNNGGAFNIWFSNSPADAVDFRAAGSDALKKVGWIAEVDHFTAAGVWQYQVRQLPPGPDPTPEPTPTPDPTPDPTPPPIIVPPSEDTHVVQVAVDGQVVSSVRFVVKTTLEIKE